ncbi:Small G protein signaling modulator 3 [Trichinella pseudospiralis]|uniref:Alpha-1,6-mannosyl-glycoprotein 2-beta-N-acetylglucosaminyltransferase n=1 Tax=Trichinella pseudospiralis TaxID=6337 RepID=A0A0V0YF08_TRIPS|nr:Small G protein signaling modulator 3 [Trichinella pseudospiralis]
MGSLFYINRINIRKNKVPIFIFFLIYFVIYIFLRLNLNEIFSTKYFKNELKSSSSLPKFENRFLTIYSILTNISQRINFVKNASANYCEDDVAEVAEAIYWAESRQAENQSDHSQIWVENGFNHNVKFKHVFMIQAHKRPSYFKEMIDSLSKVWNISEVLLVISHSAYDEEMNNIVRSIKFCPALQLFYPLRMELFQEKFPDADPEHCNRTCCRPESKRRSIRVSQIAQIKHHWWWKLVQAFEYIDALKNSDFWITLLEEDHYVSPDLYENLKSLIKDKLKFCEECQIIVPGNYFKLPVNKNEPPNEIKIEYWYSSKHNLGMTFSRTFWNELKSRAIPFCTYNDYNWDWTLNHIQTHIARNWKAVVLKSSRVFHIGDCGTHTESNNCNASLEAVKNYIKEINISTYTFRVDEGGRLFANWVTPQPFGAWIDPRDHLLCLWHIHNHAPLIYTAMFCRSQNRGYSRGFSQATRVKIDATTVISDEEDWTECNGGVAFAREEGLSIGATSGEIGDSFSKIGTPCSCLVASIVPSKRLLRSDNAGDDDLDRASSQHLCLDDYDQFGFKIAKKDGENFATVNVNIEDCKLRLRWLAYLEFTFNSTVVEDLTWEKVESFLPRSEELESLVRAGVPHSLRPYVWPRLCGATRRRQQADYAYGDVLNELKKVDDQDDECSITFGQIEKDLMRTLPSNVCFAKADGVGIRRLRRLLRSIALVFPDVGYCQGMGVIAATLLLFLDEENAFWMMCTILDDLLPAGYFSDSLLGSAVDQRIFRLLIADSLPEVDAVFRSHDIEPSLVTLHWFLTLYASSAMPFPLLLRADYSIESHSRDYDAYTEAHRKTRRCARALIDFERHEEDELGFCKNDIIEVLSRRDEHCWIGELNGRRGWFPAKFVELVDDQLRDYSFPLVDDDDDDFAEKITKLVRHQFCTILKTIFEYGMKKCSLLGRPFHPWMFIENVANEEIRKDHLSVHSRLMLSQTFQLDEDGKIFTPEELLYKALQYVNLTHDLARVSSMDVKFRSLICIGLNEQALHLWFELLCTSNGDLVDKWYQPWSFIRSPAWVQLKCELRLLSQFVFKLSSGWELPAVSRKRLGNRPIQESVRDMLGDRCPFRHSKSALGTEIVCQAWLEGRCRKAGCGYRHMKNGKTRSTTPCYWENQPGGCLKQHCVFMHLKPRDKSLSAADYSPPPQQTKASKPCKKRTYDDGRVWINPKLSVSVSVEDDDENANPLKEENNNMKKKAKNNCIEEPNSEHGELELDDLIVNNMDNDVKCGVSFQSNAETKFGKESDSNSERQSLDDIAEEEKHNEEFQADPAADDRQPNGSQNCLHRQQAGVAQLNNKSCITEKKNEENVQISTDNNNDNGKDVQKTNSKLGRAEYEARLLEVLGEDLAKTLAEEGIEFDLNDP